MILCLMLARLQEHEEWKVRAETANKYITGHRKGDRGPSQGKGKEGVWTDGMETYNTKCVRKIVSSHEKMCGRRRREIIKHETSS